MKHLRTTILVAVLLMSTMCTTKSVVLGVTPRGERGHSTNASDDEHTYSDNEPSIVFETSPSRRDSIASRYAPSPRGNTVDSDYSSRSDSSDSSFHSKYRNKYKATQRYDSRIPTDNRIPVTHRDPDTPTNRPRYEMEYKGPSLLHADEASEAERRTPRTRNLFEIFISPRHTIEDPMGYPRRNVLYPMVGPRTRRSLSDVSDELKRDVELEEKCAKRLIERMTQKGCYERLFDKDPDGFVVQWIAENATREVKHNVTCQLYRQPRETVQAWLKKAPRELFLDRQGQFNQKIINVMKDAVEEDYKNLRWFLERFCTCERDYNACWLQFTEIINKAIENNHRALQYVDPKICGQDYPRIMRLAEHQSLRAPMYVHENLDGQDYIDIMAQFLRVCSITIFRNRDRQLCEEYYDSAAHLVRITPRLIRYVSIFNLNEYYHAAKIAVEADPKAIKYVNLISGYPESCRSYCEAACIALERDYSVFNDIYLRLLTPRQRKRLCTTYYKAAEKALKKDFRCFEYINKDVLTEGQRERLYDTYYEAAKKALEKNYRVFNDINKNVLTYRQRKRLREKRTQYRHSSRKRHKSRR